MERPPGLEHLGLRQSSATLFAPRRNPRCEFRLFGSNPDGAESNPPSSFRERVGCGPRYTLETLEWEPGGTRGSGLQPGMDQEEKSVRHRLHEEVQKMYVLSQGCVDYLGLGLDPGGDELGGDSEVEPGRRAESKETRPEDSASCHLPLQGGFQRVSGPQGE